MRHSHTPEYGSKIYNNKGIVYKIKSQNVRLKIIFLAKNKKILYHKLMSKRLLLVILIALTAAFFLLTANFAQAAGKNEFCVTGHCDKQSGLIYELFNNKKVTLPLILVAGAIDGINPCAIGLLILLLGYLMVFAKRPERMLKTGVVYIVTIFITYFLIGLVFSQVVYYLVTWKYYYMVSRIFLYVIAAFIILAGLVNIKDFFWYGKGFTLGVKQDKTPILMKYMQQVSIPATIILGILVTLFELPCSLPLYVGAVTLISSKFTIMTILYLLLYNFMFILPLIVLFLIILSTKRIFELKDWQERANRWMKLSMGLAQIAIGIILLIL